MFMPYRAPNTLYILNTHLWQAGVAADGLVAAVLAVLVAVTHPAQGDTRRCNRHLLFDFSQSVRTCKIMLTSP